MTSLRTEHEFQQPTNDFPKCVGGFAPGQAGEGRYLHPCGMIMTWLFFSILVTVLFGTQAGAAPSPGKSLVENGGFEASQDGLHPDGWGLQDGATWEKEGDNHFLRLKSPRPGATVMVYRAIPLTPEVQALELNFRVRYERVKRGKESWFDARIMANFKAAGGEVLKPGPPHPAFVGTSIAWKPSTHRFRVPAGAAKLELMFTLFQAESGQIDFDDINLTSLDPAVLAAAEMAAKTREATRRAALPKPTPKVAAPALDRLPKELHVAGNELQNGAGAPVWLQGVAIPSLEWSAGGEHILQSIEVALKEWKANCIRLPVRDDFWSGHGPWQNDGGAQYRQLVEDAVNACAGQGAYLVLDLHVYRAPLEAHAVFWKEAAGQFKNHPAVLFDIINEPHDISWEVWRNGGQVTAEKKATKAVAENQEALKTVATLGLQKLVEVIRGVGAKNIIIAGGLDWGYDLSGVLNGYALEDRDGHGIMYSSHVYPWKSDWQGKFLQAAAKYPIFLGEVGADAQKLSFLPADRQEDPFTWAPDMLGAIQKYHLNWTAWSFHPQASPRVLLNWNYAPTPFWGEFVKRALAGEKFELKKAR